MQKVVFLCISVLSFLIIQRRIIVDARNFHRILSRRSIIFKTFRRFRIYDNLECFYLVLRVKNCFRPNKKMLENLMRGLSRVVLRYKKKLYLGSYDFNTSV